MAEPLPNEDVTFDAAAFEKMSGAQIADLLNSMIAAFEVRLAKLEQPRVGAEHQQIDIETDDTIDMQRIGNKFNLAVDLDQVRQQGGGFGAGGGTAVSGWVFDTQTGEGCLELNLCNYPYAIITRYHLVPPSTTVIVSVRIEVSNCPYVPCIPTPSSGSGTPSVNVDIWRLCSNDSSASGEVAGDILLPPEVLALGLATFDEPVVQLVPGGPCYQFFGSTTGEPLTPDVTILDGCDNEACSTCVCDDTCIRIETADGDYIEITVAEGQSLCLYTASSSESGGPGGGLDAATDIAWVDDQWRINAVGPVAAWSAVYTGNTSGCPTGVFTKVSGDVSAPATLTVGECAPACSEAPPERLRIAGYDPAFFGAVKTFVLASCGGPGYVNVPANEWDGTFPFLQEECIWWPIEVNSATTPLFYASDDPVAGRAWLLNENSHFSQMGFIGGIWEVQIKFEGSVTNGTIVYRKATGPMPMGVYTLDLAATSASLKQAGCYEAMPATITIEEY